MKAKLMLSFSAIAFFAFSLKRNTGIFHINDKEKESVLK